MPFIQRLIRIDWRQARMILLEMCAEINWVLSRSRCTLYSKGHMGCLKPAIGVLFIRIQKVIIQPSLRAKRATRGEGIPFSRDNSILKEQNEGEKEKVVPLPIFKGNFYLSMKYPHAVHRETVKYFSLIIIACQLNTFIWLACEVER